MNYCRNGSYGTKAESGRTPIWALVTMIGVCSLGPVAMADDQGWVADKVDKKVSSTQPAASSSLAGPKAESGGMNAEPPSQRQFGGGSGRGGGEERERMVKLLQSLSLTLDQKEKISAIFAQSREDRATWKSENQEKLRGLRSQLELAKGEQNYQRVKDLAGQIKDILATAPKLKPYVEKVNALLTPEQLVKFKEGIKVIMQENEENREKEKGRREGEGKSGTSTQPAGKSSGGMEKMMMEGDKMMGAEKAPATNKKPSEKGDKLNL